ncbi:MAG: nitrogenase component 1 [Clostridia bacterium]
MPVEKYISPITARMAVYENLINLVNCAVVDYSTMGHGLYNYGYIPRLTSSCASIKAFMTHISETDIILGSTKKLYSAIDELTKNYNFDAIFIMPSAIASVIGFDLAGVARDLSAKFNKIIISFDVGLSLDYYQGNQVASLKLIEQFSKPSCDKKKNYYNLLGGFVNEFNYEADTREIVDLLHNALFLEPNFVYNGENTIENFSNITSAEFNIVTSREAIPTAEYLQTKFNMPYIYFRPYGFDNTIKSLQEVAEKFSLQINHDFLRREKNKYFNIYEQIKNIIKFVGKEISVYAKYDIAYGISKFLEEELCAKVEKLTDKENTTAYCSYDEYIVTHKDYSGIIFTNDQVLKLLGKDRRLQVDNPVYAYKMLSPYSLPLVSFSGACHICQLISAELIGDRF